MAGRELLNHLRELASEYESVIDWNDELVLKNAELRRQLETLQSHYGNPSEIIQEIWSQELSSLFREFEQRTLRTVRQLVEKILEGVDLEARRKDSGAQLNQIATQWEVLLKHYEAMEQEYETLKEEYEELRTRYEALKQKWLCQGFSMNSVGA